MRKTIRGHPNYEVSDDGHILNKDSHIMTPTHDKDGYQVVRICENGNYIRLKTHRIVAEHFIPNPNNLSQVNHKDGNKDNCEATNLDGVLIVITHSIRMILDYIRLVKSFK